MLLSIMGLYEYDNNIFQGLQVPEGLNREAVINEILLQCAELEIMYPNIDIMKLAITTWSIANQYTWQKLYDTMVVEYNPIWNVDANVTDTLAGSESRDIARTGSGSNNRTLNLADNETVNLADNETVDITDTRSVKGFNSNTWEESEKNEKDGTDNITHTGTDNTTHTGTDNIAISDSESVDDDLTRSETRTQRRTGNIGVTTTQQMLEQERAIAEFNMISYIAQSFKQRFCLLIY